MSQLKQLSIKEFSRLTGIKRDNLRFYDRIGLLRPETRGENNYRYYSRGQLDTAYLIGSLRSLGVGIEDIKRYSTQRTPETALALFAQQKERIEAEIRHLREIGLIMQMHAGMVKDALSHDENALFLQEKESEPIFQCPPIPADMDGDEGGIFSFDYAEGNGVNPAFPQGTMIAWEQQRETGAPPVERYYFKVGSGGNACKPAGLYAIAYGRCDPWKSEPLYRRLFAFIAEQGLHAYGDAYEEYPMGDVVTQETDRFCLRLEVRVEK